MAKLVGFPTFDSTFTYEKGAKNTSLVDLLFSKGVVDSYSLHKVSHSFSKVAPSERTSIAIGVAIEECQGFSMIGFGESLSDTKSDLFTDMVQLITWAQSISPMFGYVIKNTLYQLD